MTDLINMHAQECVRCLHAPAAAATFREHEGYVFVVKWRKSSGPFCRDCGLATFRDMTSHTLIRGWWSIVSPVLSPLTVALNLLARKKIAHLAPPVLTNEFGRGHKPLPLGKPVLARPGSWIGPALMAVFITLAVLTAGMAGPRAAEDCLKFDRDGAQFVNCGKPHDARIMTVVDDYNTCPPGSSGYVERDYRYYCWSPDFTM